METVRRPAFDLGGPMSPFSSARCLTSILPLSSLRHPTAGRVPPRPGSRYEWLWRSMPAAIPGLCPATVLLCCQLIEFARNGLDVGNGRDCRVFLVAAADCRS